MSYAWQSDKIMKSSHNMHFLNMQYASHNMQFLNCSSEIQSLYYHLFYCTTNCSLYLTLDKYFPEILQRMRSLWMTGNNYMKIRTRNKRWRERNSTDWKEQDRRELSLGYRQIVCIYFSLKPEALEILTDTH